jgi:hypothetical protein
MSGEGTMRAELAELENRAERLRARIAAADCREAGCKMEHVGGKNAGCSDDCCCSVPVYVCPKCGDSDYGDNPEAAQTIANCAARAEAA